MCMVMALLGNAVTRPHTTAALVLLPVAGRPSARPTTMPSGPVFDNAGI